MKSYKIKVLRLIWPLIFRFRKFIYPLQIFKYERMLKSNYQNHDQDSLISGLICIVDDKFEHGGLVDKIKGFVSIYYLSKIAKINFYIYFSDSQNPILSIINNSIINVIIDKTQLSFSKKYSDPVLWYNYFPKTKKSILRRLKTKKQIHFYCNVNLLPVFKIDSNEMIKEWSEIFNSIFSFDINNLLKNDFSHNKFIGVHLRFMDLFGDFTDLHSSDFSFEYKQKCLEWCENKLCDLISKFKDYNFVIVSDSKYFLEYCKKLPLISFDNKRFYIESSHLGHIYIDKKNEIFEKAVADFLSLSLCIKIFQIRYGKMHNSDFSRYASYVKNTDFELIEYTV